MQENTRTMVRALKIDGPRLEAYLRIFGLSLADVAKEVQYDRSYISKVIGGKLTPSPAFLAALAMALEKIAKERRIDSSFFLEGAAPTAAVSPEQPGGQTA